MKNFEWIVIILLLTLITILLFFNNKRVSCFTGTNTLFDLNEMTFIPSDIRTRLKDNINDTFIPALGEVINNWWNNLSQVNKDAYLSKIDEYFTNASTEIKTIQLSVNMKSPTP